MLCKVIEIAYEIYIDSQLKHNECYKYYWTYIFAQWGRRNYIKSSVS